MTESDRVILSMLGGQLVGIVIGCVIVYFGVKWLVKKYPP